MSESTSRFKGIVATKGSRRLLYFAGAVIAIALVYVAFGSTRTPDVSRVNTPPQVSTVQGSKPLTPVMSNELKEADAQRARLAQANATNGAGAIPTIQIQNTANGLPTVLPGSEDPPVAPPQPPRPAPVAQPAPSLPPQPPRPAPVPLPATQVVAQGPVIDQALMAAMQRQMSGILKGMDGQPAQTIYFSASNAAAANAQNGARTQGGLPGAPGQAQAPAQVAPASQASVNGQRPGSRFLAPAAGTILYARLIGRVNSDVPGPVIAEVLQGPFSGSRILGSFQFTEEGVLIAFSTMTVPYTDEVDGTPKSEVMSVHGVAVDTEHLGTAMATDIDRHLLEKIGVGFATSFLSGLGQAVAQSGSSAVVGNGATTVTNPVLSSGKQLLVAGGAAAATAGGIFQQAYGNRRTTVTVEADTPFGLLFLPGTTN